MLKFLKISNLVFIVTDLLMKQKFTLIILSHGRIFLKMKRGNLVLACRKCNLRKSDSLTNLDFCNELIKRNINHYKEIENLRISLLKLHVNQDKWEQENQSSLHDLQRIWI